MYITKWAYRTYKEFFYNRLYGKNDEGALIFISYPKSGTNYFKILFENYLKIVYQGRTEPVKYTDVTLFNCRDRVLREGYKFVDKSDDPILKRIGYKNIIFGHGCAGLTFSKSKKIIFLYRNPLDIIISTYFYKWKNRPDRCHVYSHPRDIIDLVMESYIIQYNYVKRFPAKRCVKIMYEDLYRDTANVLRGLLPWLGIKVDEDAVEKAVMFSDKKYIREVEKESGGALHTCLGYKGSFMRSGKVGQWKEYFNDDDLEYISGLLGNNGISLSEFIVE